MNQESRHFFFQTPMGRPRLASCGFDPDDHIAEKLPAVLGIQRRNLVVQHNRNREFRIRLTDLSEHANRARPEQAGVEPGELSRPRRQRESNRHSPSEFVTLRAACCLAAPAVRPFGESAS